MRRATAPRASFIVSRAPCSRPIGTRHSTKWRRNWMWSSRTSYAMPPVVEATHPAPRLQGKVIAAALVLSAALLAAVAPQGWRLPVLLVLGIALGATLYLTVFGFTAAYRRLIVDRDAAGVRAQLVMLAVATVLFAPVLAAGTV